MKLEKFFFLTALVALSLSLGFVLACGDDDDDDDDDDASSTDDDDDSGDDDGGSYEDAINSCMEFYTSCGLSESEAETYCSSFDAYESFWNECVAAAVSNFFDCVNGVGCTDTAGIEDCGVAFTTEVTGCL